MPALVLLIGKIAFLILMFAFLAWVCRVVLREVRETSEAAGATPDVVTAKAPEFVVVEPTVHAGTRIPLVHGMTIGRGEECNLQLDDGFASTLHARIEARGDDWFVADAGSTNGTFVNRKRIAQPTLVRRGDAVQIGRTVLEVVR